MSTREQKPLAENQRKILLAIYESDKWRMTPNEIAYACGYRPGMARHGNHGRGNVARVMGPAVHITPGLTGLHRRGLVGHTSRSDGLSGTAYCLTADGKAVARDLAATPDPDSPRRARDAFGGEAVDG